MGYRCLSCGAARRPPSATCPDCGGYIEYAESDLKALRRAVEGDPFAALPPIHHRVSMGEGETPIVPIDPGVFDRPITGSVYAKLESLNPTLSFKDRGSALLLSAIVDESTEAEAVVVASTGNTATSVAAYAARIQCPCAVLVPESTSDRKLRHAAVHGGEVFAVDGSFSDCFRMAQQISDRRVINATAVYSANPYVASANRTVAFEIVDQLGVPDWVSVPVGAGPLLGGVFRGFLELSEAGIIERVPRMLAVQMEGCQPIVRALKANDPVEAWTEEILTGIGAIADPLIGYGEDGEHTREAVLRSGGDGVALTDEEVLDWAERLAREAGIYAEPASAAAIAGLEAIAIDSSEVGVALVTGHGLNESGDGKAAPKPIDTNSEAVYEVLL